MKTMIIDRFECGYAICEKDKEFFGIAIEEVPQDAKEGDVLVINDDGTLSIDKALTEKRKANAKSKTNKLFK